MYFDTKDFWLVTYFPSRSNEFVYFNCMFQTHEMAHEYADYLLELYFDADNSNAESVVVVTPLYDRWPGESDHIIEVHGSDVTPQVIQYMTEIVYGSIIGPYPEESE